MNHFALAQALGLLLNHSADPAAGDAAPNTGGGGGGGGGGGKPAQRRAGDRPPRPISQVVRELINKHGDANTALAVLAGENRDYRIRLRRSDETIEQLQGQLPSNGGMTLTPEQATEYRAYVALGKAADLKTKLDETSALRAKVEEREFGELVEQAAGNVAANVQWNPTVLQTLLKDKDLVLEMRDVTERGANGATATHKRPHVRPRADDKAAFTLLNDWAPQNAAVFMPSLTAKAQGGNGNGSQPANNGVAFHGSAPAPTGGTVGGLVQKRLEQAQQRATAGNALRPATSGAGTEAK